MLPTMVALAGAIPLEPSRQLEVVLTWLDALTAKDISGVEGATSEDYVHEILPKSLGYESQTKKKYLEYLRSVFPLFRDFHITIHEVKETPGKVLLHASGAGTSTTGRPFPTEVNYVIQVEERNGQYKMVSAQEFVEPQFQAPFLEGPPQSCMNE